MTHTIAVIDDHALVREGMVEIVAAEPDLLLVGEGASAEDAIRIVHERRPDLVCLDVNMPGGGVDAAAHIRMVAPGVKTLMFSFRQDIDVVRACFAAGAAGYVVKGVSGPELIAVVRKVLAGERHIDAKLAGHLDASDTQRPLTIGELVGAEP